MKTLVNHVGVDIQKPNIEQLRKVNSVPLEL